MATSEEEIKEAFNCFDTDHTGVIAADDIGTVIRALGTCPFTPSPSSVATGP
jgi:Ca2+-binding EF-hand superfamily protein